MNPSDIRQYDNITPLNAKVIGLYARGKTHKEIASVMGVSRPRVYEILCGRCMNPYRGRRRAQYTRERIDQQRMLNEYPALLKELLDAQ